MAEGLEYQFRVLAENAAGIGKPSDESEPVKAISCVGMPSQLQIEEMSPQAVSLTWKPPTVDGGSKITRLVLKQYAVYIIFLFSNKVNK